MTDHAASLETPSGKGQGDENFPVATVIIEKRFRSAVAAYYDFARAADDIADNAELSADDKIMRLNRYEDALLGAYSGPAIRNPERLREELLAHQVPLRHGADLLSAFRQDAVKNRYETYEELVDYCNRSANPVGRFLVDLHGEDRPAHAASDALCTVLQILNHLQDCGKDLREMNRVYIPEAWLKEEGTSVDALKQDALNPEMRRVIDRLLDCCEHLLDEADRLAPQIKNRRFAINCETIVQLAHRLAKRLRRQDPLAERVKLSKVDFAGALLSGVMKSLFILRKPHPQTVRRT